MWIKKNYVRIVTNLPLFLAVSGYPLSAAYCITMITNALETKYNILWTTLNSVIWQKMYYLESLKFIDFQVVHVI